MKIIPNVSQSGYTDGVEIIRGVEVELGDSIAQHMLDSKQARLPSDPEPVEDNDDEDASDTSSDEGTDDGEDSSSPRKGRRR